MSLQDFVPGPRFEEYRETFKDFYRMERRDDGVLLVAAHTLGGPVQLSVQNHRSLGQMLKTVGADPENEVLILTGSGYESEAEAMAAGELWRARLMRAFAALDVGADFGGEHTPSGYISPAGFAEIAPGRRALNDPPRLWAYEAGAEEPIFLSPNHVTAHVSSPHAALEAAMAEAVATGGLTQEKQVAYSLFSGSFGLASEARFALLMAAVEAMMDAKERPVEALTLIEQWKEQVRGPRPWRWCMR